MPRIKFTDRSVNAVKPPAVGQIDYFDQRLPGFALRVTEHGHKSWTVLYRHGGRLRRLTLGTYPQVSLADARSKAREALLASTQGHDPAGDKQAERGAATFGELAHEYVEHHAKPNKRSWHKDQRSLERDVLPRWHHTKANAVTRRDVRQLLDDIVARGAPIQANRILALVRKVFNFGIERDIVEVNPCHRLRRPAEENQRDRVLLADEIGTVWRAFDAEPLLTGTAFKTLLLTAQRGGEVLSMRWDDLDIVTGWWTIPAERAKNGHTHRVPLSLQAQRLLENLRTQGSGSPWAFPHPQRQEQPMTRLDPAALRVRRKTGVEFAPHDLRRTAASYMTGMGISRLTVAKILNHVERGVTAVYDRHSYDQEKRQALEAWSARLEAIISGAAARSNVVPLFPAQQQAIAQ